MAGSIRCVGCHSGIDERSNGICPKCKKAKGYAINFYYEGRHHRIRLGLNWTATRVKLRSLRASIDEGRFDPVEWGLVDQSPNSLGLRLSEWFDEVKDDTALTEGTKTMYATQVRRILGSPQATVNLLRLDIEDFRAMFKAMPLRNSTKQTTKKALRTFLTWARGKRYILYIPALPRISSDDAKAKYILTMEQQQAALERLPEGRRGLYQLMMNIGARVSEVLTLQVSDVNFARKVVILQRTWSGDTIRETTKTGKRRTLPLTDTALEILAEAIGDKIGNAYIWSKTDGTPYIRQEIYTEWMNKSGLDVPLKDATRRTFATRLRNEGTPLEIIQALLGHKSVRMTERYLDDDVEWVRTALKKADIVNMVRARNEANAKDSEEDV